MKSLTITSFEQTQSLIENIERTGKEEVSTAGTIALLSLIPYAGGAIASVVGEFAGHRKFEKVCDVLSDLNGRLEAHHAEPEKHLSKDQIIEVIHETLQTVSTASDQEKIKALKNGLAYSVMSDDSFERKQLLLHVLRDSTSLELLALATLYDSSDPYITREPRQQHQDLLRRQFDSDLRLTTGLFVDSPPQEDELGDWRPIGHTENCGQASLLSFLSTKMKIDEAATEGTLRLLDAKGLTNAGPNLARKRLQGASVD